MSKRILAGMAALVSVTVGGWVLAQPGPAVASKADLEVKAAQAVYDGLAKRVERGVDTDNMPADFLESSHRWSLRWAEAAARGGKVDVVRAAYDAHLDRMRYHLKFAKVRVKSGVSPAHEEPAAEFFVFEAERLAAAVR